MQQSHRHVSRKLFALSGLLGIQAIVTSMISNPVLGSNQVLVNGDIKLACAGSPGTALAESFLIKVDTFSGSIDDTERSVLNNPCSSTLSSCHPFAATSVSSGVWGSGGSTTGEFTWASSVPVTVDVAESYHVGFNITNQSSVDFYIDSGRWSWQDSALVSHNCTVIPRMRITGKTHGFAAFTPTPTPTNTPTSTSSTPQQLNDGAHHLYRDNDKVRPATKISPLRSSVPMSRFQQDPITTTNQLLVSLNIDLSRISQSVTNVTLTVFEYHGDEMTLKGLVDPTLNAESVLRNATLVLTQDVVPGEAMQTILVRPKLQSPIDDKTWIITEVKTTVGSNPDRTPNNVSQLYQAFQPTLLRPILLPFVLAQNSPLQNNSSLNVSPRSSRHDPIHRHSHRTPE